MIDAIRSPDFAGAEVHLNVISFLKGLVQFRTFNNGKTGVDGIPVEGSREGTCNDCFDAETHDRGYSLLSRAAATEVPAGGNDVKAPEFFGKIAAENFEGVFGEFLGFYIYKVAARDDNVGVDVVAKLINPSPDFVFHPLDLSGIRDDPLDCRSSQRCRTAEIYRCFAASHASEEIPVGG